MDSAMVAAMFFHASCDDFSKVMCDLPPPPSLLSDYYYYYYYYYTH